MLAFDTETLPLGPTQLPPDIVCLSTFHTEPGLESVYDKEKLKQSILDVLNNPDPIVAHNAPFDLGVILKFIPEAVSLIFQALEDGRIKDTQTREKLLNLASHGKLETLILPNGMAKNISYSLAALARDYLGYDLSGEKKDDDAWRLHYGALAPYPIEDWPDEAINYAVGDSAITLELYEAQEKRRQTIIKERGFDPLETEDFQVMVNFALSLMTYRGFKVDAKAKAKIEEMLAEELTPEKLNKLLASGILRPAIPPQPHKNGSKDHVEGCKKKWTIHKCGKMKTNKACISSGCVSVECECHPRMKAAVKQSIDKKALLDYVNGLIAQGLGVSYGYTDKGNPQLNAEFFDDYWDVDAVKDDQGQVTELGVLGQYRHRQKLQKLVTTEIPRMNWEGETADVVHPSYDVLKETGRTSSFASKLYPSANVQNIDPRVRNCFIPRDGFYLFSVDYSQMELGTLAQKCLDLFGFSVLADLINKGIDVHAYLGSALAYNLDSTFHEWINQGSREEDWDLTPSNIYDIFKSLDHKDPQTDQEKEEKAFYKHWRKFAKPTGLGYPGGLGPKTFVTLAKAAYGVIVDEAMAKTLRDIWLETYPEMGSYFDWINKQSQDPYQDGKYWYETPLGMRRYGASYCAAANGAGLQSPSAEGAKLAVWNVIKECHDPSEESELLGNCYPIAFVHDELIGDVRIKVAHECSHRVAEIMVDSMAIITPDVKPRAEPVLMERWDKRAEPVFDGGRLVPWTK